MSVGFIEVWPAEDDHVEDDDEAVKHREGRHLLISIRIELAFLRKVREGVLFCDCVNVY